MNQDEIHNAIQVGMTLVGGILISHGYVTGTEWTGVTGGILALVGPVWSIFIDHWNKKKVPETAQVIAPVAKP